MSNNPLVSVLMTVYNREKYIEQAISSVLKSTYTNFELIIVDDRSSDTSVEIANRLALKDARIKVYLNDKNLGDYPNRNQAAAYAKGKYLKYVDADDMIYPHGLEQLVCFMEQFPNAGYGMCTYPQDELVMFPFKLNPYEAYRKHYFELKIFNRAPLSTIIKRDVFKEVGGFSGKQHLGDFEMWHILSQKFSVVLMPQGIVWYRVHEDQQMNDNRTDPQVPFKYLLYSEEAMKLEDCPLENNEKIDILRRLKLKKARDVISASKHHSLRQALELKKKGNVSYIDLVKVFTKKILGQSV
ncbi:MAG: glycosyltransferase family A protein [Psychroserpens sp.]|uniref:glycosyltransferase family 2 protein n=1 Tax=Psychroserpens sp. TaxID=2020870 RepID=UPI003002AA92